MNGKGQFAVVLTVGAAAFSGGVALGHFLAQKRVQREIDAELNRIWHQQLTGKIDKIEQTDTGIEVTGTVTPELAGLIQQGSKLPMESFNFAKPPKVEDFVSVTPPKDLQKPVSTEQEEYVKGIIPYSVEKDEDVAPLNPFEGEKVNIFDDSIPGWNYPEELNAREGQEIYTITVSEFYANEADFKQSQLTYYKGDDMLCDSLDVPIHKYQNLVGKNLNFGHGSKDPNVVFIRNERERMEWEICLDVGRYEEEVLGLTVEDDYEAQDLKHSVPRFYRE